MEFASGSPILYLLSGFIILFVLAQSFFFLIRAMRRAKALNMPAATIRRTIVNAAVFTVAPAVAILIGVVALAGKLGAPLPWLRLSIIGALTYETAAAANAIEGFVKAGLIPSAGALTATNISATQFVTVAAVMSVGVVGGLFLSTFLVEKYKSGMARIGARDQHWSKILMSALFLGMIATFLGMVFKDISIGLAGWVPVFVMLISAVVMLLCALCIKKLKWTWMNEYALPISMVISMALAIPLTAWCT
ncbi:MAG: DUF5058 family protein [Bacillota bacterium]|nr:DUF5058 family protein [Bacillota bacterium]